jgi:hypothetical protein
VDERRTVIKKKDVIRGLRRTVGKHIPYCNHSAPLFAIAFDMVDKTALPEQARKAIWAISNACACVEKGEEGAYIKGISGLNCLMGTRRGAEKTTIQRDDADKTVLKEMNIQLRVHVAESGDVVEHYAVLIVSSPLAFSMRKAVSNTLHVRGRGLDGVDADCRRICWNRLATHVRQGFVPNAVAAGHQFGFLPADEGDSVEPNASMAGQYNTSEMAQAYDTGVDWMRVSNAESFTALFNVRRAVDWIAKHFFSKYPNLDRMQVEGFGLIERDSEFVSPQFISQCMKYDEDVDKGIAKTYKKKSEKKKKRKNNDAEDEEEREEEDEETIIVTPLPFQAEVADEDADRVPPPGYPACAICVDVHMPKTI